jgi:hypothetical protein
MEISRCIKRVDVASAFDAACSASKASASAAFA